MEENTMRDMAGNYTGLIFDRITDPLEAILRELMEREEDGAFVYSRMRVAADIEELLTKIG